jgi:hypothetical protein
MYDYQNSIFDVTNNDISNFNSANFNNLNNNSNYINQPDLNNRSSNSENILNGQSNMNPQLLEINNSFANSYNREYDHQDLN